VGLSHIEAALVLLCDFSLAASWRPGYPTGSPSTGGCYGHSSARESTRITRGCSTLGRGGPSLRGPLGILREPLPPALLPPRTPAACARPPAGQADRPGTQDHRADRHPRAPQATTAATVRGRRRLGR